MNQRIANKRIVIIGAGPGGLASAMLLAKAGLDVTVLERKDVVGGRTSTIRENGFKFDLGPTFFLYPEVITEIFQMCGHNIEKEIEMLRLDPHYSLLFEQGGRIRASANPETMKREIASINPQDADAFDAFMNDNKRKLAAFKPIFQNPFTSLTDLTRLASFEIMQLARPQRSVDSDLGSHFKDPRVRLAFSFQSKYLGMSPYKCPSLFTILSYMEYQYGVFHPRGGCGAVSNTMAELACRLGAKIRLNESVERITFEDKKPTCVHTNGGDYDCDALVINADFAQAMSTLVPDQLRRRWKNRKLEKKKYSCSTYMMYLGLDGRCDELDHHTIYISKDYEEHLKDIEEKHRLNDSPSFYVCNPGATDESMAPEGKTALYVLIPVTHQHANVDWESERRRFRKVVIDQLGKLGLKDIEKRIEYEKIITPAGWESDLNIYKGATFNLAHSWTQMLNLRPNNRFEDLDDVYLVGGGTHPGSGLPVIYESARITSKLMMKDFGIDPNWDPISSDPSMAAKQGGMAKPDLATH